MQTLLGEDIFDQLSDLDPVYLPTGEVPLEGGPQLHNLVLSKSCVLKTLAFTLFELCHLLQPVVLPVGELVWFVLAGDDHLNAWFPFNLNLF